jgi:uncharacterized membrane protein
MAKPKPRNEAPTKRSRFEIILYSVAALICLVGVGEATYLTVMSLTGQTAICGGSGSCFEVLGSKFAKIGGIPIASFGAVAYFTAFSCATFAAFGRPRAQVFFSIVVGTMFAFTLWLLFVQAFLLHAFCQYCLFSAAMIFLLAGIVVVKPRPD